jgi:hypothetical protein
MARKTEVKAAKVKGSGKYGVLRHCGMCGKFTSTTLDGTPSPAHVRSRRHQDAIKTQRKGQA